MCLFQNYLAQAVASTNLEIGTSFLGDGQTAGRLGWRRTDWLFEMQPAKLWCAWVHENAVWPAWGPQNCTIPGSDVAVEFLQPTFTALLKRLSLGQEGRVTPFLFLLSVKLLPMSILSAVCLSNVSSHRCRLFYYFVSTFIRSCVKFHRYPKIVDIHCHVHNCVELDNL